MSKRLTPFALLPVLVLGGCLVSDSESTDPEPRPTDGFKVQYVPTGGMGPFPNRLHIDQESGQVSMPGTDFDAASPVGAMNALDGFSTVSPQYLGTSDNIDPATIEPGENVVVWDISDPDNPERLDPDLYSVNVPDAPIQAARVMEIIPELPLEPDSRYMVAVTDGVLSTVEEPLAPDTQFRAMRDATLDETSLDDEQLEAIRANFVGPLVEMVRDEDDGDPLFGDDPLDPESLAVVWDFETQSIIEPLEAVADNIEPRGFTLEDTERSTGEDPIPGAGAADLWIGTLELEYFLHANTVDEGDDHALNTFWTSEDGENITGDNPMPAVPESQDDTQWVPMFVSKPAGQTRPDDGWPVIIFQHGLTANRMSLLAVADLFGSEGYAVVAIDHPLHGITASDQRFLWNNELGGSTDNERHFDMDEDGERVTSGRAGSGTHYVNIPSLLTSRDNLRQSVADILQLTATVREMEDEDDEPIFDGDEMFFVGHSLGGITGANAMALSDDLNVGTLGMPGGNFRLLFRESATFSEVLADPEEGLPAQGIRVDSRAWDSFFRRAQTIIDSADPANHASEGMDNSIHMISVIGNGGDEDAVVPNVSTDYLAAAMDLDEADPLLGGGERSIVCFTEGDHASLLLPDASEDATAEMQGQMLEFIQNEGSGFDVNDDDVVGEC